MQRRTLLTTAGAAAAVVVSALILLPACCCVRRATAPVVPAQPAPIPAIGTVAIPMPTEAAAKAATEAQFANVWFRLDPILFLDIHTLRGQMIAKQPGAPVNFDNKTEFVMRVDRGVIGMNSASLDRLMNAYVFGYPKAPLRELHITPEGAQLKQEGIIHKIVDIPFTMWADVSADHGLIRIHPTKIDICGVNGLGLLKAVGMTLEKMLKMPVERGVRADRNDLLLDPNRVLPPPAVELHLVDVKIAGDELLQTYDAGLHMAALDLPKQEKNYMYFRSGTLRMGKLLMVDADMEVVDTDPRDAFDFYLDRYNDQLSAGFTRNQPNYGLIVYMRDFADLGRPPEPGERLAP